MLGTTGAGKTHLALELASLRQGQHSIFFATKRRDPLIEDLQRRGWFVVRDPKLTLEYVDGRPRHSRILYWPKVPEGLPMKKQNEQQADYFRNAIQKANREGGWTIIVDETVWMDEMLRLRKEIESLLFHGRTNGISVIACAQRPAWISRFAYSQSDHLFIWSTNDREDRKKLGDVSGIDRDSAMSVISTLDTDRHEAAYLNTRTREIYKVIAPPR